MILKIDLLNKRKDLEVNQTGEIGLFLRSARNKCNILAIVK